ncbi:MAG: hypothetical protein ACI9MR_002308 [Myxococcota bacterium]|jgi:hypothetical protein
MTFTPIFRASCTAFAITLLVFAVSASGCGDPTGSSKGDTSVITSESDTTSDVVNDCVSQCDDEDALGCDGDTVTICADLDDDGCFEWVAQQTCGLGNTCADGTCVTTCSNQACSVVGATTCDGNAVTRCDDHDGDGCLGWGAATDCGAEVCSNGQCASVCADACTVVGAQKCEGNAIVTCEDSNADGCLEWVNPQPCGDDTCSNGACAANCNDECTVSGTTRCATAGYQTCGDTNGDGCLAWGTAVLCGPQEACSNGVCALVCSDECTSIGSSDCDTVGNVRVCGDYDSDSCLEWGTPVACPNTQVCAGGECAATCADECTVDGAAQCDAGEWNVETCGDYNSDGCFEWGTPTPCPAQQVCAFGMCEAVCADQCDAEGARECIAGSQGRYRVCGDYNDNPCLEWGSVLSCTGNLVCAAGECVASCQDSCPADQAQQCDGDAVQTCGDYNADGCIEWGTLAACDATEFCESGQCQALEPPATVLIAELMVNSTSSPDTDAFIELAAPPGTDLTGYRLVGVNGNGGSEYVSIALDGVVGSDGLYVIAHTAAATPISAAADALIDGVDFQNGPDSVQVRFGDQVVDAVGYGRFDANDVFAGEGTPVAAAPANHSLTRNAGLTDTDNNVVDFSLHATPTPGGSVDTAPIIDRHWTFATFGYSFEALPQMGRIGHAGDDLWLQHDRGGWQFDGVAFHERLHPFLTEGRYSAGTPCGPAPDAVWVPVNGLGLLFFDGANWSRTPVTSLLTLHCDGQRVIALDPTNDQSAHFDGTSWQFVSTALTNTPSLSADYVVQMAGSWDDLWGVQIAPSQVSAARMVHFDGTAWTAVRPDLFEKLRSVAQTPTGEVWAVGNNGSVYRKGVGQSWVQMASPPTSETLISVAAPSDTEVWVTTGDTVFVYNGAMWTHQLGLQAQALSAHTGKLYLGGDDGDLRKREGTGWRQLTRSAIGSKVVRSSSGAFYASGGRAGLERFDGTQWVAQNQPFDWDHTLAVWAISDDDIWLSGLQLDQPANVSSLFHWDGTSWTEHAIGTPLAFQNGLTGLWGTGSDDVYAWNLQGDVVHWDGAQWELLNGMLSVRPEFVRGFSGATVWAAGRVDAGDGSSVGFDMLSGAATWSSLPDEMQYVAAMDTTGDQGWLVTEQGRVWELAAGSWTEGAALPYADGATAVLAAAPDDVWISHGHQRHYDGTQWTAATNSFRSITDLAGAGSDVWGVGFYGARFHYDGASWKYDLRSGPTVESGGELLAAGDGVAYMAGGTGIVRYDGATTTLEPAEGLTYMGIGTAWGTENAWFAGVSDDYPDPHTVVWERNAGGWSRTDLPSLIGTSRQFRSLAATAPDQVWASTYYLGRLWHMRGGSWQAATALPDVDKWLSLTATDSGGLVAWGKDESNWPEPRCELWHYDSGTWSELGKAWHNYADCDSAVIWAASANDIWVVNDGGNAYHYDGASWDGHEIGNEFGGAKSIGGPTKDDIWVEVGNSRVYHWDGERWQRYSFPLGSKPGIVAGRPGESVFMAGRGFVAAYQD